MEGLDGKIVASKSCIEGFVSTFVRKASAGLQRSYDEYNTCQDRASDIM